MKKRIPVLIVVILLNCFFIYKLVHINNSEAAIPSWMIWVIIGVFIATLIFSLIFTVRLLRKKK